MRPKGTAAELERRRRRAVQLVEQGESPTVVARILGVRPTSVHRWRRLARQPNGLAARPVPGPTPQLTDGLVEVVVAVHPQDEVAGRMADTLVAGGGEAVHPGEVKDLHPGAEAGGD